MKSILHVRTLIAVCGVGFVTASSFAQSPAPAAAESAVGDKAAAAGKLEEIVVTAQRRSERLQDVPVAVSAYTGEQIKDTNIRGLSDIQYISPSVQYNVNNGGGFQVRGIGTQSFDYGTEQTVGIVIDDVVQGLPRNPGVNSLTDIQQIEVLRGPQGTLFGKNTSAGVITLTTKKPEIGKWSEDAHLAYGSDNETILQDNVNIPLNDTLAARASGYYQHRDGYLHNLFTRADEGRSDDYGFRGKILWEPTNDLSVYLIGDYQRTVDSNTPPVPRSFGAGSFPVGTYVPVSAPPVNLRQILAPFGIQASPDNQDLAEDGSDSTRVTIRGVSAEINYQIGDDTLTSVTAYRNFNYHAYGAADLTPLPILNDNEAHENADQYTQEIRLSSPSGQFVEYVVGLYAYDVTIDALQNQSGTFNIPNLRLFGLPYGPLYSTSGGLAHYSDDSQSYAAFGQGTVHVTDNLRLIGGARFTHDYVSAGHYATPLAGVTAFPGGTLAASGTDSTTQDNLSGRVGIQYDFAQDLMAYFTYATGYKGPTVSNLAGTDTLVKPETSDDFEIGLKSQFLDHRLTLNLAGFYEKYHNFQAQTLDSSVQPAQFTLANAGGLESKGIEMEATGRVTPELTMSAGVTYADTTFTDFTSSCYGGQPISPVAGSGCYFNTIAKADLANLAGYPLNLAPKWSGTVKVNYTHSFPNGFVLDANANYIWKSDVYSSVPDPNTIIKAYGLLGFNIGVGPDSGAWRLGIYSRNLLDKRFPVGIAQNSFDLAGGYYQIFSQDSQRTIGVVLDVKLGE